MGQRRVTAGTKLSPVERRVLELIARDGLSTREIAVCIRCSHSSARNHTDLILWKLGCKRLAAAVYKAVCLGILNTR